MRREKPPTFRPGIPFQMAAKQLSDWLFHPRASEASLHADSNAPRTIPGISNYWERKFHCEIKSCQNAETIQLLNLQVVWRSIQSPISMVKTCQKELHQLETPKQVFSVQRISTESITKQNVKLLPKKKPLSIYTRINFFLNGTIPSDRIPSDQLIFGQILRIQFHPGRFYDENAPVSSPANFGHILHADESQQRRQPMPL